MAVQRISEFDLWKPDYPLALVYIYVGGTTTLASVFTDVGLTAAAANPQTLETQTVAGVSYGKWAVPLYTNDDYELDINSGDQTGVKHLPLVTLDAENASDAVVTTTGGSASRAVDDHFADVINAEDYGAIGASSSTNTATINSAIGIAAANGGGDVLLPAGTIPITTLSLSVGVRLIGKGRAVTTLTSSEAQSVITISGDRAGLGKLTLDGLTLVGSSVGLFSKANDEVYLDDVLIKRFDVGMHYKGGRRCTWGSLSISNCAVGAKLHGDDDAGGGADGDDWRNNSWEGGNVDLCTTTGIELSFEDRLCLGNDFLNVGIQNNTGTAVKINGARYTVFRNCFWFGNTTSLAVLNDSDTDNIALNTIIGLTIAGGTFEDGAVTFQDTCQDVIFDSVEIKDVDFTLTTPDNNIIFKNCTEDTDVTISGNGEKFIRIRDVHEGIFSGQTTDAVATKVWALELAPGAVVIAQARVTSTQVNGIGRSARHIQCGAYRPGSTLDYDNQTANFTVGDVITGGTSGATARIQADSDSGATGTLTLRSVDGTFENNETITDVAGGSALVNGTITDIDVALVPAPNESLGTDYETTAGFAAAWVANGGEFEFQVTGAASETHDFLGEVEILVND